MKTIKIILISLLSLAIATPASAYTLYDFYLENHGRFPSVSERRIVAEELGISNYTGTAEQNTLLLSAMNGEYAGANEDLILGAFNPSGGGTYRLRSSLGTSETSISLSSFKEPVSNIPYTMSYLNTTIGYGTIDPQTTRSEFVSFSGITQNSDGSATLTGVSRGLTRTPAGSSCTASTTLAQRHPGQSVFILSDSPCLFQEYAVKRNDETVTGQWTFPYPSASTSPATKGYVDSVALGTATVDRLIVSGTAGETVSAGNILYLKTSDAEWYKLDIDLISEPLNLIVGVAQGSGTDGVAVSGGILVRGLDSNQSGLSVGSNYFASSTAGGVGTATTSQAIGKAKSATSLYFDPHFSNSSTLSQIDVDYQVFTASSTWTKPSSASVIEVILIGGGGGGGSGAADVTAAHSSGGGGGGGGGFSRATFPASLFGATTSVTVGGGGAGGAALVNPGADSDGNNGADGGDSIFGATTSVHIIAQGGKKGLAGKANNAGGSSGGSGGIGSSPGASSGTGGGSSTASSDGAAATSTNQYVPTGGGAGGSQNGSTNGGVGGSITGPITRSGGASGSNGTSAGTNEPTGGTGGGGGGGRDGGTSGINGGNGGTYGGGGGGGGATQRSGTPSSGAGGNGGNGIVIVITHRAI